jgi:integrase/recombinase XerC
MTPLSALVRGRDARSHLPPPVLTLAAGRAHTSATILKAWREGKSENTIRSYQHDLEDFALYLSRALGISPVLSVEGALTVLFRQSAPSAHEIAIGFRNHLQAVNMSPASINRHMAALRSLTKLGRMLGMMTWYREAPGVKPEKRRTTAGPTVADIRRMLDVTRGDTEAETRDYAIVVTIYCLGLRVSELCGLNLEDADLARGSVWIKGKGRKERELVPLPALVVDAIRRYLRYRGTSWTGHVPRDKTRGPLFLSCGNKGKRGDGRLESRSVLRIVRELGQKVGIHVWCHALRHTSITTAIEKGQQAGVGLDQIRHFSRHRTLATMLVYRDEHDKAATQRTLADVVASTLTT